MFEKLVYLASPYSHPSAAVRDYRAYMASRAAALIMMNGDNIAVFSPIAHSHPIQQQIERPPIIGSFDAVDWMQMDKLVFDFCHEVFVLQIEGWETSKGVGEELEWARMMEKPISFVRFHDNEDRQVVISPSSFSAASAQKAHLFAS